MIGQRESDSAYFNSSSELIVTRVKCDVFSPVRGSRKGRSYFVSCLLGFSIIKVLLRRSVKL